VTLPAPLPQPETYFTNQQDSARIETPFRLKFGLSRSGLAAITKDVRDTREPWFREKIAVESEALLAALDLAVAEPKRLPSPLRNTRYANPSIKLAGFGGQGILSAGAMIANAGMEQGFHTSWIPSYGPEMRGGTAYCFVNISEEPIGSPTVTHPDVLMAFNRPSLEKFEADLHPGALLMYDSTIIDIAPTRGDIEVLAVPATQMAEDLGNTRMANTIMVGAYLAKTGILSLAAMEQTLPLALKRKNLIEANAKALGAGFEYAASR
jgi:2-oxoacid:acceptor oxidoreductase gamma subunit (pyruvate/2-ketoisovalerate family)